MNTLRQQEERYLETLRRVALGTAKLILVLIVLALAAAAYQGTTGVYHWIDGSRSHLASQSERLQMVNPCPYLTNTAPASNGTNGREPIRVRQILQTCTVDKMPDTTFKTAEEASAASVADLMATVTENFKRPVYRVR
jgi:hypothetical protein